MAGIRYSAWIRFPVYRDTMWQRLKKLLGKPASPKVQALVSGPRHSDRYLAAIIDTALDAIITIDHEGKVMEFNPAAERMFGYRRSDVIGKKMAELIVPVRLRERHYASLAQYLATGKATILNQRVEMTALRADGTEFPVELAITPLPSDDRPMFTAHVRDITEQKRRGQLRNARLAITQILADAGTLAEATPRLLQAVCDSLEWDVGALWQVDAEAEVLRCLEVWHRPAVRIPKFEADCRRRTFLPGVGLPGRVWKSGKSAWIPDVVRDTNFPRAPIAAQEGLHAAFGFPILLGENFLGVVEFFSYHIREPDADLLEMMTTIGGQLGQFIERRQAEEALRQADRRKDEFLAMLAHELRNPLAPIRNSLHIMKVASADPAAAEQARQIIERQVQHMVRLVDDLSDLSRIMRGRIDLRKETTDLTNVVARAVETAQSVLDAHGQELDLSMPPSPVWLEADPTRLSQVIGNLLNNAAKYSQRPGRVWLSVAREGAQAVIRVKDEGMGIAAHLLPRVFDVFVQGENTQEQSRQGLGIGLAIVRRLVEMHGGSVTVHSEGPDKGSTFTIRLPASQCSASAPAGELREPVKDVSRRILVVDDNIDAAESVAVLLRMWGHEVRIAHTGLEALQAAEESQPEIVVLDIGLPGLDGYEVAKRLRCQPRFRKTVLAAMTGYAQANDRQRALEAGFDHHLTKPVDPKTLHSLVA
jgi:PAS domain S-box-containing protein